MKKISQKTVKFIDFTEVNVELIITISSNTQCGDPHFIKNENRIDGNKIDDNKFSFKISKENFSSNSLLFATSFNINMVENHLQI